MNYLTIWFKIMDEFKISFNHAGILEYIYLSCRNTNSEHPGWCYASKLYIAELFNLHPKSLYRIFNDLEQKQLLIRDELTGFLKTPNKYNVLHDVAQSADVTSSNKMLPEPSNIMLPKSKSIKSKSKLVTSLHSVTKREREIDPIEIRPTFNEFWDAYDKKVDRPKCELKWGKLKQEERESIIAYIPHYIDSQPDKKFRKNPYTFLNNKSWENEIIKPTKQGLSDRQESALIAAAIEEGF